MATHSSILAWEVPWTHASGGLRSMGLQRVGHNLVTKPVHEKEKTKQLLNNKCGVSWIKSLYKIICREGVETLSSKHYVLTSEKI